MVVQGKLFKPTKGQRADVRLMAAAGMSEEAISAVIGVQRQTLRKHFADDLLTGHSKEMAANLKRLKGAANDGNVAAMKALDAKFDVLPPQAPKPEPLGKKEALQQEAQKGHEGTEWSNLLN